jgi:acetyl/propionyl-CoA carboxylase alpha subunit
MFERVLIPRRGEVVVRIARTCRQLGAAAHTVVTPGVPGGGSSAVHVYACEAAHEIAAQPDGSLAVSDIVALAESIGADAIYPGYASHCSHLELARALEEKGKRCVPGKLAHFEIVRDRVALAAIADEHGVRRLASSAPIDDVGDLGAYAYEAGYPIALRARLAGGGLGVVRVDDADELEAAFASLSERAGVGGLIAQRWVERPRHIEVLVAADQHGERVALCDRERSLSDGGRRFIEECPSPELVFRGDGEAIREALFDAAIRVLEGVGHVGIMTVDFLLDADTHFWMSGARIGLPKQHAISEMVTGVDLVALELQLAAGQAMPDEALYPRPSGHAVSAWLVASQASEQEPTTFRSPPYPSRRVRVESTVDEQGVRAFDDGRLVAKVSTYAPIRHQAVLTLDRVLAGTQVGPGATNMAELRQVLGNESFRAGQYDTTFIPRHMEP